jgi:hypothetical protein
MTSPLETYLDNLKPILNVVDEILLTPRSETCLQVPNLIGMVAIQLNWNEEQIKNNDPLIRAYVRQHPEWHITRGAHGGIMKRSEYQKKEDAKLAKEKATRELKASILAKYTAASKPTVVEPIITDDADRLDQDS